MNPCASFKEWLWRDPRGNGLIAVIVGGCSLALVLFLIGVNEWIPAILGGALVGFAAQQVSPNDVRALYRLPQVWALRNLAAEIDRFNKENARLEETEERMSEQLDVLQDNKRKLSQQSSQLEGTVRDLTRVSEGLQNELAGFEQLKGNLEKFAGETGADIKAILGKAEELHGNMQRMTTDNERSLLGKIAQDLEFMDKDVGMSKYEFEKFMERLPQHCKDRFHKLGMTFESVAGSDGIIDFMEVEKMLDHLIRENKEKSVGVK